MVKFIKNYFEDTSNLKGGNADKVVLPESVTELVSFMKEANSAKIPVTISGGGTATTGARIPFGGVVLSIEKFNKILEISDAKMSATVQAGVLVEELKDTAEKRGLFYTSHPTEKLATVGGTIATNASGSRSFRYGPTRKYIKRLKMVLPDGELFDIARGQIFPTKDDHVIKLPTGRLINIPTPSYKMPDVKSSAGYFWRDGMDLIDLFVGQEGTLSVIYEIEMALVRKPSSIFSCFVFFKREEDAWDFSEEIKASSGLDILSIEYFDHNAIALLREKNANVPSGASSAIFFEQDTSEKDGADVMNSWSRVILKHNSSLDETWVDMNEKDADNFTGLRYAIPESINEIIRRSPFTKFSTDIAVPGNKFLEMMNFYVQSFKRVDLKHVMFGHIGENHLHVNILPGSQREADKAKELAIEFIRKGIALGGTVSAEHGIGKIRHKYLEEMYGRQGILEMARIKKALDPNCILGLDNIFPREILSTI